MLLLPYYGNEYEGAEFEELCSMRPYGFTLQFPRFTRTRRVRL